MINLKRIAMLVVVVAGIQHSSYGQIFIKVRPERPKYVRVVAPGPRHVWIDEEWVPRGQSYEFGGGRWAEPPRNGARWVPGHWREKPRGWVWVPGHWR